MTVSRQRHSIQLIILLKKIRSASRWRLVVSVRPSPASSKQKTKRKEMSKTTSNAPLSFMQYDYYWSMIDHYFIHILSPCLALPCLAFRLVSLLTLSFSPRSSLAFSLRLCITFLFLSHLPIAFLLLFSMVKCLIRLISCLISFRVFEQ